MLNPHTSQESKRRVSHAYSEYLASNQDVLPVFIKNTSQVSKRSTSRAYPEYFAFKQENCHRAYIQCFFLKNLIDNLLLTAI